MHGLSEKLSRDIDCVVNTGDEAKRLMVSRDLIHKALMIIIEERQNQRLGVGIQMDLDEITYHLEEADSWLENMEVMV